MLVGLAIPSASNFAGPSCGRPAATVSTVLAKGSNGPLVKNNNPERVLSSFSHHSEKIESDQEDYSSFPPALSAGGGGGANAEERCHRRSGSQHRGVLFHVLSGTQKGWGPKACSKFEGFEQVYSGTDFQNADTEYYSKSSSQRRLAGFTRFEGRIFPRPDHTLPQAVSSIRVPGSGLPIQGSSFWPINGAQGVHHGVGPDYRPITCQGSTCFSLPGRLPSGSEVQGAVNKVSSPVPADAHAGGFPDQLQEVTAVPNSKNSVLGHDAGLHSGHGLPPGEQGPDVGRLRTGFPEGGHLQDGPVMAATAGSHDSLLYDGATGPPLRASNSIVSQFSAGCQGPRASPSSGGTSCSFAGNGVVGNLVQPYSGATMAAVQALGDNDNRCVRRGLGGSSNGFKSPASMDSITTNSPHQCIRAVGGSQWSQSVPTPSAGANGSGSHRQYDSHQLYQQGGGNEVTSPLPVNMGLVCLVPESRGSATGQSYSRPCQSAGGQVVATPSVTNRMGIKRSPGSAPVSDLGHTTDRLVCNTSQPQASSVLLSVSPQLSPVPGCLKHELARPVRIRLSPSSHAQSGSEEGGSRASGGDSDSAALVQEGVVPPSPGSSGGLSIYSADMVQRRVAGAGDSHTPQPQQPRTRGLVDKRNSFLAQGLSRAAADTCVASKSAGTQKNYQSGWNHFSSWCEDRDIHPNDSSVASIVDYLQSLLEQGKSFYTARARISAIAFFHPGRTFRGKLGSQAMIQSFVSGAKRRYPPLRDRVPSWDLPTVLKALMAHPYEPIQELSLAQLTYKTLFLVAVCSARRIGELQALDCRAPYCSIGLGGVVLKTHESFVPKVPSIANMEKSIEFAPYGLDEDGSDLPEHTLCVCRAIQFYIQATRDIRKTNQFFVTFKPGDQGRAASKITMAGWLKKAIQDAYQVQGLTAPEGVKAHSARHASTSWAELRAISVLDICQQASWAAPNTFVKHYRLDLSQSVSSKHARAVLDVHAYSRS